MIPIRTPIILLAASFLLAAAIPVAAAPQRCYSVQVASYDQLPAAEAALEQLRSRIAPHSGLRLERIGKAYTLRVGCTATGRELAGLRQRLRRWYPDAMIRPVYRLPEREIATVAAPPAPPAAPAPAAPAATPPGPPSDPTRRAVPTVAGPGNAAGNDKAARPSPPPATAPAPKATGGAGQDLARGHDTRPPAGVSPAAASRHTGLPWPRIALGGGTVLLLLGLGFGLFHRRQAAGDAPGAAAGAADSPAGPAVTATTAASGLPTLLPEERRLLGENRRELAMIQANCLAIDRQARTFYIASAFAGEGRTTVAVAMAWGLAVDAGNRVLLVDASADRPRLHHLFATAQGPGLTDLLCEEAAPEDVLRPTSHKNLTLVTYGTGGAGTGACSTDPLRSERFPLLLEAWKNEFDYVVCDGHPVLHSPNAAMTTPAFDGVVLVAHCERTKWEVVEEACQRLTQLGGRPLAVVLNRRRFYIPRFLYRLV